MREAILSRYGALRARHAWVRGLDVFLEAGFVMSLTAAAMLLVDRLAFDLNWSPPHLAAWPLPLVGGSLALAAALAGGFALLRRAPPAELARLADRSVGGDERFLSALECAASGAKGGFVPLVLRDAARLPVVPRRVFPRPPVRYRWGIGLALLTAGILHAVPPQIAPAPVAGFRAMPERGAAPIEVAFESLHQGLVDEIAWDFGDGAKAYGADVVHRFDTAGRYTVVQELRGPGGRARHERTITVLPKDHPVAAFEAEPVKGRAPLAVRFVNLSQNAERFEWDFGDGTRSPDPEPRHLYAGPGEYTVKLRAFGPAGEDDLERPKCVRVVGEDPPLADFRAHPRTGKAPLQVAFEDLSTGKVSSWSWDFGDLHAGQERFSPEPNPTHAYRFPGRYTVTLRVRGPGGEDVEEKVAYIVVETEGGGGAKSARDKGGAGSREGRLYGPRTQPRRIGVDPEIVTVEPRGGDRTMREKRVYSRGDGSGREPQERKVTEVFPHYERAAEETMGRERIPPAVREYVRKYFEEIRPK